MSEVYQIFSGERVRQRALPQSNRNFNQVAKANDRFRKNFSWKTEMSASIGFMRLSSKLLTDILSQLRKNKYDHIDFGGIREPMISSAFKQRAQLEHSAGIIHTGEPVRHVIWEVNKVSKKIELCMAEEYFC